MTQTIGPAVLPADVPAQALAIRTKELRKVYRTARDQVVAASGIDLEVPSGEFFGLLGPNGAGKSTIVGMLTTVLRPTGGQAWVMGADVMAHPVQVKRRIGLVRQNNTLDLQLTVAENLEFRSRFFGFGPRQAADRARQLLDAFALMDRRKAMAAELSGGQARRLMIARALTHRPDVLFLDEPTAGLDPQTRVNLWEILRVMHDGGQTIFLTTHYLEEAEALCDRIAVVDHGKVLAAGTVDQLKASAAAETLITVRFDAAVPAGLAEGADLPARSAISRTEIDLDCVRVLTSEPEGVLAGLIAAGTRADLTVCDAAQVKPSLETAFLSLTGRGYRE